VCERACLNEPVVCLDECNECFVGLFDVDALDRRYLVGEQSVGVDGTGQFSALDDDLVGQTDPLIVLSEGRRLVHDARPGVVSDVVVGEDSPVLRGIVVVLEEIKKGLVLLANQVLSDVVG